MASDARISTTFSAHPKTKKLIRRHGHAEAWGLVCLFLWTAGNRPDGDLVGMSDEDIELAVDWAGDNGALVKALKDVGFLDGEEGSYSIHDWAEHNPWAAGSKERSEASKFAALCKRYGREKAEELMPDHAPRMRPAHEPDAPRTETACAPDAESSKLQCPVTVTVSDTVSNPPTEDASASVGGDPLKARIWGPALEWLGKATKRAPDSLRPMVGKWCADYGDGGTLQAIEAASKNAPLAPIPYINKILKAPRNARPDAETAFRQQLAAIQGATGFGPVETGGSGTAQPVRIGHPDREPYDQLEASPAA